MTAWAILRDSYHGNVCLEYSPEHIAVAVLYFALQCHGVEVPYSDTAEYEWWQVCVLFTLLFTLFFTLLVTIFFTLLFTPVLTTFFVLFTLFFTLLFTLFTIIYTPLYTVVYPFLYTVYTLQIMSLPVVINIVF